MKEILDIKALSKATYITTYSPVLYQPVVIVELIVGLSLSLEARSYHLKNLEKQEVAAVNDSPAKSNT